MTQVQPNPSVPPVSTSVPVFPAQEFPAETRHARLLGIYPQRQEGLWMQRVRIPGGILSAGQWRAVAGIARRFTPATPLHLTTRQDVELHDLAEADVPRAQQALAEAGLTSLGSGGDTLRNITVCPCAAGGTDEVPDLLPLALATGQVLAEAEGIFSLPRKFKISFGCRQGCGRPFIHDLAFLAELRDGQWGLRVVGASSLGPKPATGIVFADWVAAGMAPAMALTAVRVFARLGDRQNRGRARLRHVRQRLGDEAFLAEWHRELDAAEADRTWPGFALAVAAAAPAVRFTLTFPNGDLSPGAADALADLAATAGLGVRIANDHRVILFAADTAAAQRELAKYPVLSAAARPQANVLACPGTRWCARALADTNALADRIRASLAGRQDAGLLIAISGCPNGCAFSGIADIGIVGGRSTAEGQTIEKYALLTGGGQGRTDALAQSLAAGLSAQDLLAKLAELPA